MCVPKTICIGKRFFWKSDLQKPLKQLSHIPVSSFKSGPSYLNTDNGIVIYRGINAIMSIFEKMISQPHNTRIYGIQPDNSIKYALRKVSTKEWNRVNTTMKKQSLIFEGIVHEKSVETVIKETGKKGALDIFNSFIGRLEDYVKIPDEFANVEAEIYIFKNSAYIVNWNKEMAIEIIDKDMVSLLLAMFSSVKILGQRYSQTKRMEIYKESIRKKLLP